MQTRTKNKVPIQESAGFAEKLEDVGHGSIFTAARGRTSYLAARPQSILIRSIVSFFLSCTDKGEALILSIEKFECEGAVSSGSCAGRIVFQDGSPMARSFTEPYCARDYGLKGDF